MLESDESRDPKRVAAGRHTSTTDWQRESRAAQSVVWSSITDGNTVVCAFTVQGNPKK
jgi:hypothetical protein